MDDVKDPFDWLYDENITHTPSTAVSCLSQWDNNYEPAYSEVSPSQQANGNSGEKAAAPDGIRNIIPSRIVSQYLAYCNETIGGSNFKPLAPSSLFAIHQKCAASTRKSLAGLDNFSSDGGTAFDQLRKLCDEIATFSKYLIQLPAPWL
ncbi:unnamed protein product [Rotaria socialis]|uniref:Uncharacterized protein n=1 Tax=Rotaria socialis TaxID=392032 RepID=A0A818RAN5_9BILA|nr:unnamed protein product [Rotaria socialis]